jgi:hypothetical protein
MVGDCVQESSVYPGMPASLIPSQASAFTRYWCKWNATKISSPLTTATIRHGHNTRRTTGTNQLVAVSSNGIYMGDNNLLLNSSKRETEATNNMNEI